jgi:phosphoribosylformylglycinamidine cyclo-ligase
MTSEYEKLGASASKAGLHQALKESGLSECKNYFAQVFPDSAGDNGYRSFLHCDGAGTKSVVAYLMYRETGDARWFRGLAQDALVMNLDDCLCLGPVEGMMLANAIARNSRVVPDEALREIFIGYRECVETLFRYGITLQLAGGETADTADVVRTILVDAVLSGRVRKDQLLDTSRITPGDVIVGVSSAGQSSYESSKNSGIGSNGLTLARHALLTKEYQERYPETSQLEDPGRKSAAGKFKVTDTPEELQGMTVGEALLSPTRTFAPLMAKLFSERVELHGVIHNTGGGVSKVLRFGRGNRYVKEMKLTRPPIFDLIKDGASVSEEELHKVFNMGMRLEIYLPKDQARKVLDAAAELSLEAAVIGVVESLGDSTKNEVRLTTATGEKITYSHIFQDELQV